MNEKSENSKLLIAGIAGGVAGLMLGAYIWGNGETKSMLSKKLKSIANMIEQLEEINSDEANSLKDKLKSLLLKLNETYGKSEK